MKKIILTEWLKVKSYRTFWVVLILALLVHISGNVFVQKILADRQLKPAQALLGSPFDFPNLWLTVASISSYLSALYGLLLIILVTNEYTFRTNRQNIIDGWERRDFVYAKLFWLLKISGLALVVTTLIGLVEAPASTTSFSFENYHYVLIYFMQVVLTLSIALAIAVYTKRAGIAIIIFFAYTMLEQPIVSIIKHYIGKVGGLLPIQTGDELMPPPIIEKMIAVEQYPLAVYFIFMVGYIVLAIWLVFRKILKSDL
ncbi:ABC transporter permease [Chitinophaga sp. Hz27]|uniref:ABC transporter permease n=1 Tax=Chitinophaga sp. Hz27 TaxID=3347169 RepID=UPI0035E00851